MRATHFVIGFILMLGLLHPCSAYEMTHGNAEDGTIKIRLSYKIILNPSNLRRPNPNVRVGGAVADAMIVEAVDEMNALLASYWRGYRFELCEIVQIGARGGFEPDPAYWFDFDFVAGDKQNRQIDEMIAMTAKDPERYAWRKDAINIYINQATSGAKWRIKNFRDVIVVGADSVSAGWLQLHEIGHYFGLHHTHGDLGIAVGDEKIGQKIPGDDRIADTIQDLANWDRNGIAAHNFSRAYAELEEARKELVEDVAVNVMSYHFQPPLCANLSRLTEKQLDRWADIAEDYYRKPVRDGRTLFVDVRTPGYEGTSTYPFDTVKLAVEVANKEGGDTILLRPGAYNEKLIISKPVTLRATRSGPVSIGTMRVPVAHEAGELFQ